MKVANYLGADYTTVVENPAGESTLAPAKTAVFDKVPDNLLYEQIWSKGNRASQACAARARIYSATDGVEDDAATNDYYWQLKEKG